MLGGELTKLKEEVNIGADSVIKNSEKLKNTIRKNSLYLEKSRYTVSL